MTYKNIPKIKISLCKSKQNFALIQNQFKADIYFHIEKKVQ